MYKVISKLIGNTERTIFVWKKENRYIVNLLEKYFSKKELEEFMEKGTIQKLESFKNYEKVINLNIHKYLNFFISATETASIKNFNTSFMIFYFSYLVNLARNSNFSSSVFYLKEFHAFKMNETYEQDKYCSYSDDMFREGFFDSLEELRTLLGRSDYFILLEEFENIDIRYPKHEFSEALFHFVFFNVYKYYNSLKDIEKMELALDIHNCYSYKKDSPYYLRENYPSPNIGEFTILHKKIKANEIMYIPTSIKPDIN